MVQLTRSAPLWAHGVQISHVAWVKKKEQSIKIMCVLLFADQKTTKDVLIEFVYMALYSVIVSISLSSVKRCPNLSSTPHGSFFCSNPHGEFSFASRCTSTCEEGFVLNGTADTDCTFLGKWSRDIPRCLGKKKKENIKIN